MSTPKDIEKQLAALQTLLDEERQEMTLQKADEISLDVDTLDVADDLDLNATLDDFLNEHLVVEQQEEVPVLRNSIKPADFLRYRKHKTDQIMFLIRQYLKKHGTPKQDSTELAVLKKAITRILDKPNPSSQVSSGAK